MVGAELDIIFNANKSFLFTEGKAYDDNLRELVNGNDSIK